MPDRTAEDDRIEQVFSRRNIVDESAPRPGSSRKSSSRFTGLPTYAFLIGSPGLMTRASLYFSAETTHRMANEPGNPATADESPSPAGRCH